MQADEPLTVRLDVVNVGGTDATIGLINFVTIILEPNGKLPQRPPYNEPGVPQFPVIPPFRWGSEITFTTHVSDRRVLSEADVDSVEQSRRTLYFVGTIEYRGDHDGRRQTAFCRRLVFSSDESGGRAVGRFKREKDPDYEYRD